MIGSRVMAVGDVHGQYDKLKKLMRKIKFDPAQDKLIFLGDLIDRGPESLQCFDYVMHLQKQHPESVIYLMGNHEREMLDYYDALAGTKDELDVRLLNRTSQWLVYGGDKTLPQLQKLKKSPFILPHGGFLFLSCRGKAGCSVGSAAGKRPNLDQKRVL